MKLKRKNLMVSDMLSQQMDIKVFDDLLDDEVAKKIEDDFDKCPWNVAGNIVSLSNIALEKYKHKSNVKDYIKFVHDFYELDSQSDNTKIADIVLDAFLKHSNIKNINLLRAKANMQTQFTGNNSNIHNTPHVDFLDMPHHVLIYYVNDSDGDTIFFDNKENEIQRVKPKRGRYAFFNGNILHAGCNPIKSNYRIIINYNMILSDD